MPTDDDPSPPPVWFVALIHPEMTSVSVPISVHGSSQSLVITSHPDDEMTEIWDGIVTQLEVSSAIAIALFLITMMVVGRALAPLQALSQAMTNIGAGHGRCARGPGGRARTGRDLYQAEPPGRDPGRGGGGKAASRRAHGVAAGSGAQGNRARIARRIRTPPFCHARACRCADAACGGARTEPGSAAKAWRRHAGAGQCAPAIQSQDSGTAAAGGLGGARGQRGRWCAGRLWMGRRCPDVAIETNDFPCTWGDRRSRGS